MRHQVVDSDLTGERLTEDNRISLWVYDPLSKERHRLDVSRDEIPNIMEVTRRDPQHGTENSYKRGCRCGKCRAASAEIRTLNRQAQAEEVYAQANASPEGAQKRA